MLKDTSKCDKLKEKPAGVLDFRIGEGGGGRGAVEGNNRGFKIL